MSVKLRKTDFFIKSIYKQTHPSLWSFLELAPNYEDWSMRRNFNHLDDLLHFIKHHCGDDVLAEVRDSTILREISNE